MGLDYSFMYMYEVGLRESDFSELLTYVHASDQVGPIYNSEQRNVSSLELKSISRIAGVGCYEFERYGLSKCNFSC